MGFAEEGRYKKAKGKSLVVADKVGGKGRELLTWVLMKVAKAGDLVTVVQVFVKEKDRRFGSLASPIEASTFDVYESFCRLKKIRLQVKVACGSPIRGVLIEEALRHEASYLIVGRGKHRKLGSASALANNCAKRLPCTCSVLVVDDGKIILEKVGTMSSPVNVLPRKVSLNSLRGVFPSDLLEKPARLSETYSARVSRLRSCSKQLQRKVIVPQQMDVLKLCLPLRPLCMSCTSYNKRFFDEKQYEFEQETSTSESRSSFDSFRTNSSNSGQISQKGYDSSISSYNSKENVSPSEEIPPRKASEPGWPLLKYNLPLSKDQDPIPRTLASKDQDPTPRSLARQLSVVEWAMRLPERRATVLSFSGPLERNRASDCSVDGGPTPTLDPIPAKQHSLLHTLENICRNRTCRQFTYQELYAATAGFAAGKLIGNGGWSRVYRGDLADGQPVAVKSIKPSPEANCEVLTEVEIMTTVKHEHIVSLMGYCVEDQKYYLVYNLLTRGSLEDNLHGSKCETPVPWKERLKVAIGIAEALEYLHHSCPRPIIHRDVKSSNILLSDNFEPQLSDFGLAKWASTTAAYITCSDVVGTFGYLAPEYFMYGKVNEKTDVYSFGVVLLELITGRKPIDNARGQESLVMWARPMLGTSSVSHLVDPLLVDDYDSEEARRMILAASLCLMQGSRFRPPMNEILRLLRGEVDTLNPREIRDSVDIDGLIEDEYGNSRSDEIRTHLTLALLGVNDHTACTNSLNGLQGNKTLEDYLKQRCSDSSS